MSVRSLLFLLLFTMSQLSATVPVGFVELKKEIPDVVIDLRYYGENNFLGHKVDGYEMPVCYITTPAAKALKAVQEELKLYGLGLKIFDAYRPQRAVDHFVRWAKDLNDTKMKQEFYPDVEKSQLFEKGYIAAHSGHSRGSTVDLTLIDLKSKKELDMGTNFDFFSPLSWPSHLALSTQQRANRLLLHSVM